MAINNLVNIKIKAVENLSEKLGGIKSMAKGVNSSLGTMVNVAKNVTVAVGGALAGIGAFGVKSAISIEQTRVAFENLYGDASKAKDMMQSLSNFAKKTPFEFPELTDVALKLKNVAGIGDKELIPMLTNLGDIASSQGKGISQIVEAYNDAITGEFERLKEFGIKAKQEGDNVTFTFRGQEKTVKKTSEAIGGYLAEIGKMEGITGAMDKQSMTLGGRLSTLKDQFKSLSMAIIGVSETGDIQEGGVFDKISQAVGTLGTFLEQNQQTIVGVITTVSNAFQFAIDTILNVMNQLFTGGTGDWIGFFDNIKLIVLQGLTVITDFWNKYGEDIMLVVTTVFNVLKGIVENFFKYIGPVVQSGLEIIGGIFKFFGSLIKGDFGGAFTAIEGIIKGVLTGIFNVATLMLNLILGIFGTSTEAILIKVGEFSVYLIGIWEEIKTEICAIGDIIKEYIMGVFTNIASFVTEKIDWMKNKAKEAKEFLSGIMDSYAQSSVGQAVGSLGTIAYDTIHGAKAVGGPVTAGSTYRVNEQGQEFFTPSKSGYITPAGKGGGITLNMGGVQVYNEADEDRLIEKMKRMLTQEAKNYNLGIS